MHLQEVDSHKPLGLLFLNSLSWHSHILSLHHRAMLRINHLRSISNVVPGLALLSIFHSFILEIFDDGSVVYDTCSQPDAFFFDTAQTTAAKIITGCMKTTVNDGVLKEFLLLNSVLEGKSKFYLTEIRCFVWRHQPSNLSSQKCINFYQNACFVTV